MSPERRTAILFWCQVGLYLSIMGAIITVVLLFAFWLNTLRFDLDEDRAREKAMLQQHYEAMADHVRAREQHSRAFDAMLQRHGYTPGQ
jgi:hypothetical protein